MKIEEVKQKGIPVLENDVKRGIFFGITRGVPRLDYNKKVLEQLAVDYGLRFIILYGSYATGKTRPDSDLDIAAVAETSFASGRVMSLYSAIAELFEKGKIHDVDFKLLNNTDPLFRYQVVRDGVLLYGSKTDYEEYKSVTYRMYEDAQPLRDLEYLLVRRYQNHLHQYYA